MLLVTRLGVYRRTRMDAPRTNSAANVGNTNLERRQQVLESSFLGEVRGGPRARVLLPKSQLQHRSRLWAAQ